MQETLGSPAFQAYQICAAILSLQLVLLGLWTGTVRTLKKQWINPEDAKFNKGEQVEADHPDVARTKRAHLNALENAVPFFVVGFLYALSGPSARSAWIYFGVFLGARLLHTLFYFWGKQPFRTLSFGVGALTVIGMAFQILV